MADTFNWSLGHEGKGNVYHNGDISTWNINDIAEPHHDQKADQDELGSPAFRFYVTPEGGLHDGGITFQNESPHTDDQQVAEVVARDPALYDARNAPEVEAYEAEPRVETGGGYGHAYNLLDSISKVAKEEGWPDFHTELKIPRAVRKKIRRWVDHLKWPEESEKEDARRYHITILSMDEYDDKFAKWAKSEIQGKTFHFESTRMDIFADVAVVLRFDSPEWTELVLKWQELADKQGLEPRKFDPPKAHITIGKSPSGKWPQGVPDPHVKFDTRMFNINRNSAVLNEHGRPEEDWDFGRPWTPGAWGKGFLDRDDQPVIWQTSSPQSGAMQPIHYDYSQWLTRQKEDEGESPDDAWQDPENHPIAIAPNGEYSLAPDWALKGLYSSNPLLKSFETLHPSLSLISSEDWSKNHMSQDRGYGHAQNVLDTLNKNSWHESMAMTLPQEQRQWQELQQQYPVSAEVEHEFPNGYTLQHNPTKYDTWRVGKMMHNCWQHSSDAPPEGLQRMGPKSTVSHLGTKMMSLHDENGIPRAVFYHAPTPKYLSPGAEGLYPGGMVNDLLADRNHFVSPDQFNTLQQWAEPNGVLLDPERWLANPTTAMTEFNKNSMAVDPEWHQQWTEANPYLYHGRYENADLIRQHGIEGSFASYYPTPSVYLTDQPELAEHFARNPGTEPEYGSETTKQEMDRNVYKIDARKLDPNLFDSDEWNTTYPEGMEYHGDQFGVTPELEQHVSDPAVVQHQWERGSPLAYRGTIPPEAIVDHWPIEDADKPLRGRGASVETTPADDLKAWLDSFTPEPAQALSPYHTSPEDFTPQAREPVIQAPHVDPPSKPYQPYNWAEEGWEESPLNRVAIADPNRVREWIDAHGPYMYYGANHPELDRIGIQPSEGGYSYKWGSDGPRPGHVYLANNPEDAASYGTDPDEPVGGGHLYQVDIRHLNPANFNPNENDFESYWDPEQHETIGEWAEATGLGDDPEETHESFNLGGPTYRGLIPPEAITKIGFPDHTGSIDKHPCPECGEDMDGQLCPVCGHDGLAHPDSFKDMERSWYDRAWSKPGEQPQPTPHELHPMHWRDDSAKNVSLASHESDQPDSGDTVDSALAEIQPLTPRQTIDEGPKGKEFVEALNQYSREELNDLDHPRRWYVGSVPGAWNSSDDMSPVWRREQGGPEIDQETHRSKLPGVRSLVSRASSVSRWHES